MSAPTKLLIASLLAISAYMLIRASIYKLLPIYSTADWFLRDTIMTIPRLLGFAALLFALRRLDPIPGDWRITKLIQTLFLGAIPISLWNFYFSQGTGERFTFFMIAIGTLTSAAVGLFEETAFRGALFSAFQKKLSTPIAILSTSALFTLFHFQAQSTLLWPAIFLTGVAFANLRARGMTLVSLSFIHALNDSLYFLHPANNPDPFTISGLVLLFGMLRFAVVTFKKPDGRS